MTLRLRSLPLVAALLLGLLGVPAQAGVGDYPSPLYMAGPPSSLPTMGASYRLIGTLQPAPTAAATGSGTGPAAGTYRYVYTVDSGGGESASAPSPDVTTTGDEIQVGNLPTGVTVRVYRLNVGNPSYYYRVAELVANASSQFVDNVASPTVTLKTAENRVQSAQFAFFCTATTPCTGYFDFPPGYSPPGNDDDTSTATMNKKGWVVDGPGSVHFPAGDWTFTVQTKSINPNGVAYLTVAMWKVDGNGNVVGGPILAAVEDDVSLITAAVELKKVDVTASVPAFSLGQDEHLYVQFWRHQTTSYSTGGPANRLATLFFLDGVARIEHPGAVADPSSPTQTAPADALRTNAWPQLAARFDDPVAGDTGTLDFELCSDAACASVLASSSAAGLANGATGSFAPGALGEGTYYWRVRAQDSGGGTSGWAATRSFTYDTTSPAVPSPESPPSGSVSSSAPALQARFESADGLGGTIEFRVCSNATCGTVVASTSVSAAAGQSVTFSPPLDDGTYHWQARAVDAAGNASGWSAPSSLTYDRTPPQAPGLGGWIAGDGLTLRWVPPPGEQQITLYALYVDGVLWNVLGGTTSEAKLGPFDAADTRSFTIAASDAAGNWGPQSDPIIGVPNLLGLSREAAEDVVAERGLVLAAQNKIVGSTDEDSESDVVVVEQAPKAPALVRRGSEVRVALGEAPAVEGRLLEVSPKSVSCTTRRRVAVRIVLLEPATVSLVLVQKASQRKGWRRVAAKRLHLEPGATTVRLGIRRPLSRRLRYELRMRVTAGALTESHSFTISLGRRHAPSRALPSVCTVRPKPKPKPETAGRPTSFVPS